MKTTFMLIINDFLVYGMISGQSTYGKLACPYYMENNKAFTLTNDDKMSFFTTTDSSCQWTISSERTEMTSLW